MRILTFPTLTRVALRHFSLYTLKDEIEFSVTDGIVCLAGANELGKSTFLQVIIYGLTGVVPKPGQKFVTVDEYYRDFYSFTPNYLRGRLLPEHRDIAEIELELSVGGKTVLLSRGFVESDSLRELKVTDENGTTDYDELSAEERHDEHEG